MGSVSPSSKTALVFGASGVTGWSFVNEILNDYPSPNVWSRVVALTNRPLSVEASSWPKDSRLSIVSGIDLLQGSQDDLQSTMTRQIPDLKNVTHMYYLAYKASKDLDAEYRDAVEMFSRATIATDQLCPHLEFVVLQTGAKMYGCHLLTNKPAYMQPPLAETLPRLKQEDGGSWLFYLPQLDFISEYAKDKSWNWCETRPDIIIGFVPNQNFYSLATVLGIYLSLFRQVEGEGAECPFPGTNKSWAALSIDSCSDMIARQTIHLSLTLPEDKKGWGFNVADARNPESWETKWPQLCHYFGLKGTRPPSTGEPLEVRKYINDHLDTWTEMEQKDGLKKGIADSDLTFKGFEYFLLTQFDFDRQYDMTRMYDGAGFKEERDVMQAWGPVFDRMRAAKLMP